MKRLIAFVLVIGLLCALFPSYIPNAQAANRNYEDGLWNIDHQYRQLRPNLTKGGYWDSTDATNYKKVITTATDSANYFATPRFTKSQLPIGSIIVVEAGWQYRPEGWVKDVQQSSRPDETSQKHIVVTSAWWGSYTYRAFNISRIDGTSLSDLTAADIHEAFRIYLPDEYVAQGYERYFPKLEHCAYWNSTTNKIYTVNSMATATNYFATQRMNRSNLPVGSIIVFEKGWQVQPEAWLANEPQAAQQSFITSNVIHVTEEWWGDYTLRAFNISKTTPSDLTDYTTEDMHCIFRVYIPKKTLSIEGLPDEQTNAKTKIHQLPSMTPLDDDYEKMMSYIIQTRGGKIIVIDGGCPTQDLDGNYLFSYLQRITGSAAPHIDAWFLTHQHADHFGAFLSVATQHGHELTVDAVYHRFPTTEEMQKYMYKFDLATYEKYMSKIVNHTAKLKTAEGKTTPLISVNSRHSGKCNSTFDYDEVHIDILLTVEDVYWGAENISGKYVGTLEDNGKVYNMTVAEMLSYNMNETSLVFRATFNGKSVLFLGDGTTATEIMLKYYHEQNANDSSKYYSLKSDIVQVSHHGVQAMGKEVYTLINPDAALWCTPYKMYASRPGDYLTTYHIRQWFKGSLATTNYISYDGVDVLSYGALRYDNPVSIAADIKPYVFDAAYYANRYPDLKAAYGTDEAKLYNHFINYGIEEGRCASPYFDVKVYMNQNSQNF
ncbi:MAG: MBL fold metallo-hydrolase [Ruminococcaceae bacterium]|nr:MBL fold metallo-hydrolase [Oscillospiraceae bacterium]